MSMGKRIQAIGMVLCIALAVLSHLYSDQINELFQLEDNTNQDNPAPLVGLQQNESWLVVLVDFDSNPLTDSAISDTQDELKQHSEDYFSQATGQQVSIDISVHDGILRAPKGLSAYGADGSNGRDYGDGGQFLPALLAEFVVESMNQENLGSYDLNDDGVVDRFLILHSTIAQEQGGGSSNRIWSHFTSFIEPIKKADVSFEHYTMSSMRHGSNGFGTILHEMMHQFGAFDLYPVHDSGYTGSWKGIGVWDIMASGNWNGGGDTPSLPTGPTMNAIGHGPTRDVLLEWPDNSQGPCIGPSIPLESRFAGGDRIRIQIDENEFVWIELRTQEGYDESLPGDGVLVLLEDLAAGDTAHNAMNIDQRRPYLKTIEADGNQEQLRGINDGVASDLFQPGDEFGERGIQIRDHDGVLVPWYAKIVESNDKWSVEFHSINCSPKHKINLEDFGSTLLQDEPLSLEISTRNDLVQCWGELTGSDGRTVVFSNSSTPDSTQFGTFSSQGALDSTATFSGFIYCDDDAFDIKTSVTTLGSIPLPSEMKLLSNINVVEHTTIRLPYTGLGDGNGEFSIDIDGPLSRVATTPSSVEVENGNGTILIEIDPQGLLQENMYVLGTIHLQTFNGEQWDIEVELKAQSSNSNPLIGNQSLVLSIFFILFAAWFASSYFSKNSSVKQAEERDDYSVDVFLPGDHL